MVTVFTRFSDEKPPKTIELQLQGILKARVWGSQMLAPSSKLSSRRQGQRSGASWDLGWFHQSWWGRNREPGGQLSQYLSLGAIWGSPLLFISWHVRESGPTWLQGQGYPLSIAHGHLLPSCTPASFENLAGSPALLVLGVPPIQPGRASGMQYSCAESHAGAWSAHNECYCTSCSFASLQP